MGYGFSVIGSDYFRSVTITKWAGTYLGSVTVAVGAAANLEPFAHVVIDQAYFRQVTFTTVKRAIRPAFFRSAWNFMRPLEGY